MQEIITDALLLKNEERKERWRMNSRRNYLKNKALGIKRIYTFKQKQKAKERHKTYYELNKEKINKRHVARQIKRYWENHIHNEHVKCWVHYFAPIKAKETKRRCKRERDRKIRLLSKKHDSHVKCWRRCLSKLHEQEYGREYARLHKKPKHHAHVMAWRKFTMHQLAIQNRKAYNKSDKAREIRRACNKKYRQSVAGKMRQRIKGHNKRLLRKELYVKGNNRLMADWMAGLHKKKHFTCYWCGKKTKIELLHGDHIVALANKGKHELSNFCASCADCNIKKSAKPLELWVHEVPRKDGQIMLAM